MTLPEDVAGAIEALIAHCPSDLQTYVETLRARLLSQDAEIERKSQEFATQFIRAREWAELSGRMERRAIDAESRLAAADAEVARLRESNKKLHRRCQEAEAALPSYRKLIALPPDGDGVRFVSGTMGRALLVSMCNKLQAHGDAADALLNEIHDAGFYRAKIDAHLQGAGDEA